MPSSPCVNGVWMAKKYIICASAPTMIRNAIASLWTRAAPAVFASAARCTSRTPPEQSGGPDQQHDHHDDEDHRIGCFGEEDLGQSLDDAQPKSRHDCAHDRA